MWKLDFITGVGRGVDVLTPQFLLPISDELVVDLFAGGGGASTGIERAIGRHVDVAINHDPQAVSLHQANHPQTLHFVSDVFEVDPVAVAAGRPIGLLWASPDCKHFSKAKGGKPVSKKIRSLAWVVVKWAQLVRPRVIFLENVEEFQTWGPLAGDGRPCPERRGLTFRRWKARLENLGYRVEHRELRACDFGAPTIRKRLFLIARRDGAPIVWPMPTHGKGRKPYRTAAECIDWSLSCPSIFERERPLAEATLRRIAHGIKRYVLDNPKPFIVGVGGRAGQSRPRGVDEPFQTVTAKADSAIAVPTLVQTGYGERPGQAPRVPGLEKPLGTCVDGQKHALVAAFLARHYGGVVGTMLARPLPTVTAIDHHSLVTADLGCVHGCDEGGIAADRARSDRGPTGWNDLEASQREPHSVLRAAPAGNDDETRIPRDTVLRRREAVHAGGAPAGVDGSSGADSRGDGSQSRRREQDQQRSGEPRAGDARSEPPARVQDGSAQGYGRSSGDRGQGEGPAGAGDQLFEDRRGARGFADDRFPGHAREVAALLCKYYGNDRDGQGLAEPLHTVPTRDRFGLVTVEGADYEIADIGMRMLQPRELYRAQGFPDSYAIDRGADGRVLPKSSQVRMCGNSVCPPVAEALVRANFADAMRAAA